MRADNAAGITAVFTFVEKKVAFFLNCGSTAVSFLLPLRLAHMGANFTLIESPKILNQCEIRCQTTHVSRRPATNFEERGAARAPL